MYAIGSRTIFTSEATILFTGSSRSHAYGCHLSTVRAFLKSQHLDLGRSEAELANLEDSFPLQENVGITHAHADATIYRGRERKSARLPAASWLSAIDANNELVHLSRSPSGGRSRSRKSA